MATVNDIATVEFGSTGPTAVYQASDITITVVEAQAVGTVGVPVPAPVQTLEVVTAGPQGPKGDQNVFPQATAPTSPQVGDIWIKVNI